KENHVLVGCKRKAYARIPRCISDVEDSGILEKELALFRKELAEVREIHGLLVRFHLSEVRIDREIECQSLRHSVLHVESAVGRGLEDGTSCLANRPRRIVRFHPEVV